MRRHRLCSHGFRCCGAAILALCLAVSPAFAGADEDWQKILETETRPPGRFESREQARVVTLQHLARQEQALRAFLRTHPADPRQVDGRLRLAHLLSVRADLKNDPSSAEEARTLLDALAKTAPESRGADVTFARISLFMRHLAPHEMARRGTLLEHARAFQKRWPGDRRIAPLLAEVATLYDDQPSVKAELLRDAQALSNDEELKARIRDDVDRIARLGKPVSLRAPDISGGEVDVEEFRGKIVVICWFADWSPPSIVALEAVRDSLRDFPRNRVQPIGVSLDDSRQALAATLRRLKIDWPVAFDGKGWESPAARGLGINSLPTIWVLDAAGRLRVLNVRDDVGDVIRALMRSR